MDPEKNIDEVLDTFDDSNDEVSVDDFIRQLEEKEKDLHITVETSIIEIAESFDDANSEFDIATFKDSSSAIPMPIHASLPPASVMDSSAVKELEREVKDLNAVIAKMEAEREDMFKNSHRRSKDFDAFKARAERERKETFQNQISNVATLMLPALDNLSRALDSAEHIADEKDEAFQQFYEGIVLVSEQINEILNKMGIKPIPAVGHEFDPHYHEAVATDDSSEYPPNTISGEILRGYIAGEKVIRHSMVKVVMKSPEPTVKAAEPEFPIERHSADPIEFDLP